MGARLAIQEWEPNRLPDRRELMRVGSSARRCVRAFAERLASVAQLRESCLPPEHSKEKLGLSRATELVSYANNWFRGEQAEPGGERQ